MTVVKSSGQIALVFTINFETREHFSEFIQCVASLWQWLSLFYFVISMGKYRTWFRFYHFLSKIRVWHLLSIHAEIRKGNFGGFMFYFFHSFRNETWFSSNISQIHMIPLTLNSNKNTFIAQVASEAALRMTAQKCVFTLQINVFFLRQYSHLSQ